MVSAKKIRTPAPASPGEVYREGTNLFRERLHALAYYQDPGVVRSRGYDREFMSAYCAKLGADIDAGIAAGEIRIGSPGESEKPGNWDADGRWVIHRTREILAPDAPVLDLDPQIRDIVERSAVDRGILFLPPEQLDARTYAKLRAQLEFVGLKWKSSAGGFLSVNPGISVQSAVTALLSTGGVSRGDQYFPTPVEIADLMVSRIPGPECPKYILEPSAGRGALLEALVRRWPALKSRSLAVHVCELNAVNRKFLLDNPRIPPVFLCADDFDDFKDEEVPTGYNLVIANPPFWKSMDIRHIRHMHSLLASGGFLVTLASTSWCRGSSRAQVEFRSWLAQVGAIVEDIPAGSFKSAGTDIPTRMITIQKG